MRIGVPTETAPGERRVALVPEIVRKLTAAGHEVVLEAGAGGGAGIPDALYEEAGATVGDPWGADAVLKVAPPSAEEAARLGSGSVLIGFLAPLTNAEGLQQIAATGATAFAMESIPRISRAQSMDALSSQATVSGYLAVITAAEELPRFFPMLMTAAGTIRPAQVLVLGAGVAGLQAIATARRLGAVVTAFDVRSAVKEQIQSLGAKFFEVEGIADASAETGYARELTEEEQERQRAALQVQIAKSDVVITTALVPGRPAPKLITAEAVANMGHGAVVIDLAAEAGGNCEGTVKGEIVRTDNGVTIDGRLNLPSRMAEHASQLYARNVAVAARADERGGRRARARLRRRGHQGRLRGPRRQGGGALMDLLTELAILVLAAFVGFEVISKVPNTLHTPLMSGTNAIHGIVLLGGLLVIGPADGFLEDVLVVIAIAFGTINVVGGFLVTDRMLGMFKSKPEPPKEEPRVSRADTITLLYIVAFAMFIIGLHMLRGPRTAVRGNQVAAAGMAIAVIATLIDQRIGDWVLIVLGLVIGTAIGVPAARSVRMTAMPQMVALFNGVGGGAVALISLVEYREALEEGGNPPLEALIPILFAAIIGSISFWGSNVAFLKLQETLKGRFPVPRQANAALAALTVGVAVVVAGGTEMEWLFWLIVVAAGALGVLAVLPIGGADMPVVISTLNAFTGLSAASAGIALDNTALIVAGMLVGASGSILTRQMAEAMNRSIGNVFFSGLGAGGPRWRRRPAARCAPRAPPTSRSSSPTPASWSSSPATAWRSPRPSAPSPTSPPSSSAAASRSCTRSTRSPAACPAT